MSAEDDIRVQLARMEGKQDVTNERLNNVQSELTDVRRVQHNHASDIQILKADKERRDGERSGIGLSGKIILTIASLLTGTGIGAGILELLK